MQRSRLIRRMAVLVSAGLAAVAFTGATATAVDPVDVPPAAVSAEPPPDVPLRVISSRTGYCVGPVGGSTNDGAALIQEDCAWEPASKRWFFRAIGPGQYEVRNAQDPTKCLDQFGHEKGMVTLLWACHGGVQQQWYVRDRGGVHEFQSRQSLRCMDTNTFPYWGTPVWQWDCSNEPQQRFRLG